MLKKKWSCVFNKALVLNEGALRRCRGNLDSSAAWSPPPPQISEVLYLLNQSTWVKSSRTCSTSFEMQRRVLVASFEVWTWMAHGTLFHLSEKKRGFIYQNWTANSDLRHILAQQGWRDWEERLWLVVSNQTGVVETYHVDQIKTFRRMCLDKPQIVLMIGTISCKLNGN